jgi:hypothetical protein
LSRQDGDVEQRRVLTDAERLEKEVTLRIITNKHNLPGTEQLADLPVSGMLKKQGDRQLRR